MPEQANAKIREMPAAPTTGAPHAEPYAELEVTSNFSFLRGASHPDELVFRAAELGYRAIAITDHNSLAGVVRAHDACKQVTAQGGTPPRLIIGARLTPADGPELLAYATDRAAYGRLCRLLTLGRRRAKKGECLLSVDDVLKHSDGLLVAIVAAARPEPRPPAFRRLREALGDRLSLAAQPLYDGEDDTRLRQLVDLAREHHTPLLATNAVHYHDPCRKPLQDVLTCVRHRCTIQQAGYRLFPNAERYLKPPRQLYRLFESCPRAIRRTLDWAERCSFDLDTLKYEYPEEIVPAGLRAIDHLSHLAWEGARHRYNGRIPDRVCELLTHELELIEQLHFEAYFLTVYDLVTFARSRGILCQGRGSAANSAVCYCLGVTSVDPSQLDLLFERFVSAARGEPPDIDIDFEHERREEVLQYIYQKYGRERAGMTGVVITYRGRSAVRDVGKALGLSLDLVDSLAKRLDWWDKGPIADDRLREVGVDPSDRTVRQLVDLTAQVLGFPRHLSQHTGGMVMTRGPLCELVPIEDAAMENRTVIEWDKDDIDTLGILKVDCLALGMLTCISKALRFANTLDFTTKARSHKETSSPSSSCLHAVAGQPPHPAPFLAKNEAPLELHTIPAEDPAVYDMISAADTIGVFQVESRAQMSMLPRLRPRCFYDLVIEVAIVRPGPIQGNMVHPYLRRRNGEEQVSYPSEALRLVLEKTLGVPLFQEQAMRVAMVGAGFTASEADQLRRAMAAWRKSGAIERFYTKIIDGMLANGYTREFAEQCFLQIRGFGEYGFPESHSASFARLVYVSAWLKRYHPAAFCAALLNSQPMGFYAPAQIVKDARDHGVEVRPADVNASDWDCTLEEESEVRGQRSEVRGLKAESVSSHSSFCIHHSSFIIPSPNSPRSTWGLNGPAVRLGLRRIKGLREVDADAIVAARRRYGPFAAIPQFQRRTAVRVAVIRRLAEADAFASLGLARREALWEVMQLKDDDFPLFDSSPSCVAGQPPDPAPVAGQPPDPAPLAASVPSCLPPMPLGQEVMTDYAKTGLSLKQHPVALVRQQLAAMRVVPAAGVATLPHGRWVKVAGIVLIRQRPGTANGIVFQTLEDETGIVNLIIRPDVFDRYRAAARHAGLLAADGYIERQGAVMHVLVKRLHDLSALIAGYEIVSRDFQ